VLRCRATAAGLGRGRTRYRRQWRAVGRPAARRLLGVGCLPGLLLRRLICCCGANGGGYLPAAQTADAQLVNRYQPLAAGRRNDSASVELRLAQARHQCVAKF
jgi:hypothetical protein